MKYKLLLLICLFSFTAKADDTAEVHLLAHAGASYAINTFIYGACEKGLGLPKNDSLIISTSTTLAIGLVYKMLEFASVKSTARAFVENTAGVAASGFTIKLFNW
jgi:hypothetical protein